MMLAWLLALNAVAQSAATAPPPLPMVRVPMPAQPVLREKPQISIEVRVEGGGRLLWSGPLRLSPFGEVSHSQETISMPDFDCPKSYAAQINKLNVNVGMSYTAVPGDAVLFRVKTKWERPTEPNCTGRLGSRVVEITDAVAVQPGGEGIVQGDAGLRITVRRR